MLSTTPVQQNERALILDVLRGIAILGIFLNNIYGFSGYGFLTDKMRSAFTTYGVDKVLNFFQIMLVEGKFYSLFSLLFGIGFSIILIRNQQRGINPLKIFYRRLFILLLIGLVHIYGLWQGDILLLYAMVGMLLPAFQRCSNKALLIWAVVLILSPILFDCIKMWVQWSPSDVIVPYAQSIDTKLGITEDNWRTYLYHENSGWKEFRNFQATSILYRYEHIIDSNRIPKVLGMFLLGFYVGRNNMYANLLQYKPVLKKLLWWGFGIGLPFSFAMAYFEGDRKHIYQSWWGMADTISYALGVVPLCLAYVAAICLYWIRQKGSGKLTLFAPAGRMALTNYISQTLIGMFLFYAIGLGFGQRFGLVYLFMIVLGIYILQIIFSTLWFRYFAYGPLEWVWRQLTYGKRFPIKKQTA